MGDDKHTAGPEDPTLALETVVGSSAPSVSTDLPDAIGGYTIVNRLGGGGMGDVYVAFDERLRRRVALKVIRAERRIDRRARDRFLREARMLSALDHPNICRIHDYLESPAGDFLVLELIEGRDLDRALPDLNRAEGLRIAESLARVLAVAHASGIVHRDLKPANVMLAENGDIKVLDFGLARIGDASQEDVPDKDDDDGHVSATRSVVYLTQEKNAVVGTPLYMSPEQARGEPVTPASDLYSFGLMLQEMFTGQRPYEEGLTVGQLLQRAAGGRTLPVKGLPHDITHLIERLKSFEPGNRPSAREAADRLTWIRGKPKRRLRRLAVAAGLLIAALAGLKYTIDLGTERSQAIDARNEAESMITFILGDLRPHFDAIGKTEVTDSVADRVMGYFSRLPERDLGDDDLIRRSKALALVGQVRMDQGNLDDAEKAFEESLALSTDVVSRRPEQLEWIFDLAQSEFYVAYIRMERGDLRGAKEKFEAYRDLADHLVATDGPKPRWRMEQAYAHTNLGGLYERMGWLDEALLEIESSIEIKEELAAAKPDDREARRSVCNSLGWLASARFKAGDMDGAGRSRMRELSVRQDLVDSDPAHAGDRTYLAKAHSDVGELLLRTSTCEAALAHFRDAGRILEELVAQDPANLRWQRDLAVSHRFTANALNCAGDYDASLSALQQGRDIMTTLVETEPDKIDWRLQLAMLGERFVNLARLRGDWSDALAESEEVMAVLAPLLDRTPVSPWARFRLAELHCIRGRVHDDLSAAEPGHVADARLEYELMLAAIEPVVAETGMLDAVGVQAEALLRLDRVEEARPIVERLRGTSAWSNGLSDLASDKGLDPDATNDT